MKEDVQNFDASTFNPEKDSPTINLEETIFPALGTWLSKPVWKEGEEKVPKHYANQWFQLVLQSARSSRIPWMRS